jgi:hypothetical protein
MIDHARIQIELTKLRTGERLFRLTDSQSGLSLERKIDPTRPVTGQKEQLISIFEAALARAELSPA